MTQPERDAGGVQARKAGVLQIAKTLFFVLLMIGKRETWEAGGDGARMTPRQIVVGAIVGAIVLIALLVTIVRVVLALAGGD